MVTPAAMTLPTGSNQGGGSSERRCMPLWDAPKPWLQQLVNNKEQLDVKSLQNLMAANWAMSTAVLRCMQRWELTAKVSLHSMILLRRNCCLCPQLLTD